MFQDETLFFARPPCDLTADCLFFSCKHLKGTQNAMTIPFGETLRRLRIEKGLSQQQLADRLHMERSSISNWEAGRRIPAAAAISQLAKALGVDAAVLFAANEEPDEAPNVLLVDDETVILVGGLPVLRQALPQANVVGFTKPMQAVEFVREHPVALAFLDIELGRVSGLDLCRELLRIRPRTNVIYLTGYREYAFDAFPIHPFDYLIKPYKGEQLNHVLSEAHRVLSGSEPEITVRIARGEFQITFGQIVSVVSQGHTVNFGLTDGSFVRATMTFGETEKLLTADERFLLCNRGILINMDHVKSMDGETFFMNDGSSFPLRTKGRMDLIKKFSQYQISQMRRGR